MAILRDPALRARPQPTINPAAARTSLAISKPMIDAPGAVRRTALAKIAWASTAPSTARKLGDDRGQASAGR